MLNNITSNIIMHKSYKIDSTGVLRSVQYLRLDTIGLPKIKYKPHKIYNSLEITTPEDIR